MATYRQIGNIKGAKGDTGPTGPKGATGATGLQGPKGDSPHQQRNPDGHQNRHENTHLGQPRLDQDQYAQDDAQDERDRAQADEPEPRARPSQRTAGRLDPYQLPAFHDSYPTNLTASSAARIRSSGSAT